MSREIKLLEASDIWMAKEVLIMSTSSITNNFVVDRATYDRIMEDLKNVPPRKELDQEKIKPLERSRYIIEHYPFH